MSKWTTVGVLVLMVAVYGTGCATLGGRGGSYGPADQTRAQELFAALKTAVSAKQADRITSTADELINSYPRFAQLDEVYFIAGQNAAAQGRTAQAAVYYDHLATQYPTSAFRAPALLAAADAYDKLDDSYHAVERLLMVEASPLDEKSRAANSRRLASASADLTAAQVDELAHRYPHSGLARDSLLREARSAYANGDYDRSYQLVTTYLDQVPHGENDDDARRLLDNASERRQTPPPGPATRVSADHIGIIFPQTGSLALYGRLFEQGAKVAVDEFNEKAARHVTLVEADSRGGAIDAVKGVRKLVVEDGAIAVVGDVFTLPAIAGAIECNAWRTPIVSPVVASDDLVEIGPWVFQTRVPATVEATALAETAVKKLGLSKFAVLSPSRGDRLATAQFFADEVKRLGGQVVANETFAEGATDFKDQLQRIHDAAPDALFAIGSIEELLQILPQTRFFDLQAQLLGTSQWNSDKLLRLARDELEGAVFPAEAHYGSTPERDKELHDRLTAAGATDVNPVAVAAYYGTRAVLEAVASGAASRDDVRVFLDAHMRGDADVRRARAEALPLVRVHNGAIESFAR